MRSLSEAHTLSQWELVGEVDRVRRTAHVRAPRVRARLAPAAGGLLATERSADLSAGGPDVHVDDPAVRAVRRDEPLRLALVAREDARRQALRDAVVQRDGLVELAVRHDVEDRRERLGAHDLRLTR